MRRREEPDHAIPYTRGFRAGSAPRRVPRQGGFAALLGLVGAVLLLPSRVALVEVQVDPAPERVALRGGWPVLRLRSRFVAFTGRYMLEAEKSGYRRLEAPVEVERGAVLRYSLRPLPGRLAIRRRASPGPRSSRRGGRGTTPLAAFEVEPASARWRARRGCEEHRARVVVEGRGTLQSLA
jgi:hypothetical protein